MPEGTNSPSTVLASMSNGTAGKRNSAIEARVRKLEHRLTGGKPPVSPRTVTCARMTESQQPARDTTTDSSQLVNSHVVRCLGDVMLA